MASPLDMYMQGTQIMGGTQIVGAQQSAVQVDAGNLQRVAAGIPSTSVGAGLSSDLNIVVSEPFRPDRIVLSVVAQALQVTNVKIGTKSLNVSSNPISGNCFSQDAVNTHLQGYTAQPGVGFVISVLNPTGAAVVATGGIFGPSVN